MHLCPKNYVNIKTGVKTTNVRSSSAQNRQAPSLTLAHVGGRLLR